MKLRPGQVWTFDSGVAAHPKHHLCVTDDYGFLFVNTPRRPPFPSDLVLRNSDFPFLRPTACGRSAISCSRLIELDPARFRVLAPRYRGSVTDGTMQTLVDHLLGCRAIADEQRERALDGLGPFFVWAAA